MHTKALSLFFCCLFTNRLIAQLPPIGQWREHYNWSNCMQLVSGEEFLWCATGSSFFSIAANDQFIQTYGKLDGISSIGISKIGWESGSQTLVAAFNDGNIDLLNDGVVRNIPDFKRSTTPDKKINSVTCTPGLAYLGTQIGLLVVDLQKKAIKDTYIIGNNGQKTAVWATGFVNNRIYAFDSEGLKSASLASNNLADYRNWSFEKSIPQVKPTGCFLLPFNNSLLAVASDSIFILQNNTWNFFFTNGRPIISLSVNGKQLLLTQQNGLLNQCLLLNENGIQLQVVENGSRLPQVQQFVFWEGTYWLTDASKGLFKLSNNQLLPYFPEGPAGSLTGNSTAAYNGIWAVSGTGAVPESSEGIFNFTDNRWSSLKPGSGLPANFKSLSSIVSDDVGKNIWTGSLGGGLLSLDQSLKLTGYAAGSGLEASSLQPSKVKVSGLSLDESRNLWVANSEAPFLLKARKPDGKWFAFKPPFALNNVATGQVLADDYHQVWIQMENAGGLLLFNYGSTLENPSDDRWKWFQSGKGNGNLPDNNVLSMAKDQNGFVWVGTKKGLAVIQCTEEVFGSRGCEAVIPIVQTNNFAGYLLGNEEVSCLTVDGANRIWAGTRHGLWLLSEDGEKTYYRFNTSNSPLPSDSICSLTLDGNTGELFIGTSAGMVSFRSTATDPSIAAPKLQVFPQPVPPGYNGSIAIRGMSKDAVVKITELDGRLVYETRSLGGQAIWNGRNYKGEKMATGVYLVWIVGDDKTARMSTKIVFIGK